MGMGGMWRAHRGRTGWIRIARSHARMLATQGFEARHVDTNVGIVVKW